MLSLGVLLMLVSWVQCDFAIASALHKGRANLQFGLV